MSKLSFLVFALLGSVFLLTTGLIPLASADFQPRISDGLGVTEWEEWSFANKDWWADVSGQGRNQFTKGIGTVAVSDPDEWSDIGNLEGLGLYSSFLQTPAIALNGAAANSLVFQFDSSWRPEDTQGSNLVVAYDDEAPIEILNWSSDLGSVNFKNNAENETVILNLNNPVGAQTVTLIFGMYLAANDWWWAIDNLTLSSSAGALFAEDFESLPLGPTIDEFIPTSDVFTQVPPAQWNILSGTEVSIPSQLQDTPGVTHVPEPSALWMVLIAVVTSKLCWGDRRFLKSHS